jgi:hypothetical protein
MSLMKNLLLEGKTYCPCCSQVMKLRSYRKHLQTKKHELNFKIQQIARNELIINDKDDTEQEEEENIQEKRI